MAPAAQQRFDARFGDLASVAYRVAFRVLGSRPDAEDVAQEALARAFARWERVEDHAEAWVARVATNLAIGHWRGRRRTDAVHEGSTADGTALSLDRLQLTSMLRRLPRRQREVIAMRYLADLTEADVAAALGCSVGTVKQHGHRGLAALRQALAFEEGSTHVRAPG